MKGLERRFSPFFAPKVDRNKAQCRNGEIPNESAIKATIDFTSYKAAQERALPKFKYYAQMMAELKKKLDEEIKPLITR